MRIASGVEGIVHSPRRRYLSPRVAIALLALTSFVVPGIVAVIAADAGLSPTSRRDGGVGARGEVV